ncbi:MAG: helix-turn-helix transcriptional regulator [Planctomycetales bacterium]|nr:helix-turn-helix transcriptional regulator [Planctomycetales bacterium]
MAHFRANGRRISYLRHLHSWTQEQLGSVAGYSERTIRNAESETPIAMQTLIDIAGALEVELCEIMAAEDYHSIVKPKPCVLSPPVLRNNC